MSVVTSSGTMTYAGLISGTSTPSSGTARLTFLTATGTPNPADVGGFDLRTSITTNPTVTKTFGITSITAVPEPATYAMLLAGGVAALACRRRRR